MMWFDRALHVICHVKEITKYTVLGHKIGL